MLSYISTGSHDENDQVIVQTQSYTTKRHPTPLTSPSSSNSEKYSHGADNDSRIPPSKVVEFSFRNPSCQKPQPYDFLKRVQAEVGRIQRAAVQLPSTLTTPLPHSSNVELTSSAGGFGCWSIRVQFYTVGAAIRASNTIKSPTAGSTVAHLTRPDSREITGTEPTKAKEQRRSEEEGQAGALDEAARDPSLLIKAASIKAQDEDGLVNARYLPFFMLNEGELLMDVSKIDSDKVSRERVIEHISDAPAANPEFSSQGTLTTASLFAFISLLHIYVAREAYPKPPVPKQ
jgi:hypothetical protein